MGILRHIIRSCYSCLITRSFLFHCYPASQWTWRVFKDWKLQPIEIVSGRLRNSGALLVTFWLVTELSLITLVDHVVISATSHLTLFELHGLNYSIYAVITIFLPRVRLKSSFKSLMTNSAHNIFSISFILAFSGIWQEIIVPLFKVILFSNTGLPYTIQ